MTGLKLRVRPQFPSLVEASSPLSLAKTNGNYYFGLDITALRASLDPVYVNEVAGALAAIMATTQTINFNAANTDTAFPIPLPVGSTRFTVNAAFISGASGILTTATIGLFTAAAGGGVTIVTTGAITVNTAAENTNNNTQALTILNGTSACYNVPTIYARVGAAQGVAATGKLTIHYRPLP